MGNWWVTLCETSGMSQTRFLDKFSWEKNCIKLIQNRSNQLIYNSTKQIWFQKALGLYYHPQPGTQTQKDPQKSSLPFSYCRPDLDASNQDVTVYSQAPNPPHLRDRGCDNNLSRMHWSTQDIIQQVGCSSSVYISVSWFQTSSGLYCSD